MINQILVVSLAALFVFSGCSEKSKPSTIDDIAMRTGYMSDEPEKIVVKLKKPAVEQTTVVDVPQEDPSPFLDEGELISPLHPPYPLRGDALIPFGAYEAVLPFYDDFFIDDFDDDDDDDDDDDGIRIRIVKKIINDSAPGNAKASDFNIKVDNQVLDFRLVSTNNATKTSIYKAESRKLADGIHEISEDPLLGYVPGNWSCKDEDNFTVNTNNGGNPFGTELNVSGKSIKCEITNDDTEALLITGVIEGPGPMDQAPRAVELRALHNIADLSIYGLGSADDGGGSDGEEYSFPNDAVAKGQFITVAIDDNTRFNNFFSPLMPTYVTGASPFNFNGNDAIELFKNANVIDVFGDIDMAANGQPWAYLDGWAYREDGTGPDGSVFVLSNWSFSGINTLDGKTSNATANPSFPIGSYSP